MAIYDSCRTSRVFLDNCQNAIYSIAAMLTMLIEDSLRDYEAHCAERGSTPKEDSKEGLRTQNTMKLRAVGRQMLHLPTLLFEAWLAQHIAF